MTPNKLINRNILKKNQVSETCANIGSILFSLSQSRLHRIHNFIERYTKKRV